MTSVLSSFFSRDPRNSFPYDIPTDSFTCHNGIFLGNSFKKSDPNEKATCFWANTYNGSLKLQAQKLKTLRHPNVLIYFDYLEIDSGMYLITESCQPLEYYLRHAKLSDAQKELFVSWGFYQILNCLKFLHNEVKISQNNLKESIFITSAGDWKLSGFHNTTAFSSSNADLNDLAAVAWHIFNGFSLTANMKSIGQIPKRLHPLYKKLLSSAKNVTAEDLLSECRSTGGFMRNKFVDTLLFLDEYQLKDSGEKQTFFMHLKDTLDMFPEDVAKRKILPKLIHAYEYGDAGSHILVPMFKLGRLLDEDEYQYRIVPCLVKLFSSSDRSTRVKLLEKIDEFAPHLSAETINDSIYGNLVTGFTDTNPAVRESTVKAMVSIAEKLNYYNLNSDLMKYLARLQGCDDQPGIRTNTTICLGKIGCYIDASHRQRILISAFTRALKDPFPPARIAGVLALSATQQYYSLVEIATKILPSLAPLTVDPEKEVREQGFKALKGFLENLEKASENPEIIPELEAQVNAGGRSGLLSSEKVPQWASWALKAISGKFYKSTVIAPPTPTTIGTTATAVIPLEGGDPLRRASVSLSTSSTPLSARRDIGASTKKASESASDINDGWGDTDDEFRELSESATNKRDEKALRQSSSKTSSVGGATSYISADIWAVSASANEEPIKRNTGSDIFGVLETSNNDISDNWDESSFFEALDSLATPKSKTDKANNITANSDKANNVTDGWANNEFSDSKNTTKKEEKISSESTSSSKPVKKLPVKSKGGALKLGGPMKLGAKKITGQNVLPADLEKEFLS